MAFKDIEVVLYGGTIKIQYKDKTHRYFRSNLQSDKTWSKPVAVKGVTTILGDTLEKKGLQLWPMGLALTELFGFYDFEPQPGNRLTGFSKGKGTLWDGDSLLLRTKAEVLPLVVSASKAHTRRLKTGADVGSLVHDAIEQYVLGTPFELTLDKYISSQTFESPQQEKLWFVTAGEELAMAEAAYSRFKDWWEMTRPSLVNAEMLVYSDEHNYCGSFDALLRVRPEHHPVYSKWQQDILVMTDWKTSNASVPAGAPMGVYYSHFIQDAAYAAAYYEMTGTYVDDLLVVSARKDGSFDTVYASEVGLTVPDAISWWKSVVNCNQMMTRIKHELVELAKEKK